MKKLVSRLIWFPVGAVIVLFFVANRQPVAVSFDPISTDNPVLATRPLFLWVWLLLALLIGVFIGAAGMWVSGRPARARARAEHKELKALKRQAPAAAPAESPEAGFPALTAQ